MGRPGPAAPEGWCAAASEKLWNVELGMGRAGAGSGHRTFLPLGSLDRKNHRAHRETLTPYRAAPT